MKKLLAILLAAVLLLSVVACTNTPKDPDDDPNAGKPGNEDKNPDDNKPGNEDQNPDDNKPGDDGDNNKPGNVDVDLDADVTIVPNVDTDTLGYAYFEKFLEIKKADSTKNAEAIANDIINSNLGNAFQWPMVVPVEPGYLSGFSADINGFESAVTFGPGMMGVAFMGYVFDLAEDADVAAFVKMLGENANPRWNVCTEAEMTAIGAYKNSVILVMCEREIPSSVSGAATILAPEVAEGSESELVWNDFKALMSDESASGFTAFDAAKALAEADFENGAVTEIEGEAIENKDVFMYTVDGFDSAALITAENASVYVLRLGDGIDAENWANYYFDGVKAEDYAYGAYGSMIILMINVG